jgi:hypothetical protein
MRSKIITEDELTVLIELYKNGASLFYLEKTTQYTGKFIKKLFLKEGVVLRTKENYMTDFISHIIKEKRATQVYSDESRKKMSESQKKRPPITEETRKKLSLSQLGKPKKPEAIEKTRQSHIGTKWSEETRRKINRKKSQEQKEKLSFSLKKYYSDVEMRILHSESLCSFHKTKKGKELREKLSTLGKENWLKHPELISKRLASNHKGPNKTEKKLEEILSSLFPNEWKFVGCGEVIIAGKCPDFINVNGQKKIIELYGDYWHRNDDPQDRINLFKPFGYDTLVIWEKELRRRKDLPVLWEKLKNFSEEIKNE